jgi:hypothetical protein
VLLGQSAQASQPWTDTLLPEQRVMADWYRDMQLAKQGAS